MTKTLTLFFYTIIILGCKNEIQKDTNLLKGKIYNQINEIPELEDFEYQAESMIDYEGKSSHEYKFAVSQYFDKNKYLIILEEKLKNGKKISSKIVDTILINHLKKNENIVLGECCINDIHNSQIIAVIKNSYNNDEEYFKNVVKAWKADPKTGKIFPIHDLKEVDCFNEGFGL
ncbi:hypothetical protein [Flavobacterium facile]|uniref:hypothetical protein n=1 Tax=Flavobacterium facile TaxID=2893174 RepID=UPI002E781FF3|nr:hypothetical protein [Flavobacterium sp. T-12]